MASLSVSSPLLPSSHKIKDSTAQIYSNSPSIFFVSLQTADIRFEERVSGGSAFTLCETGSSWLVIFLLSLQGAVAVVVLLLLLLL